jgi:hypothetical protein
VVASFAEVARRGARRAAATRSWRMETDREIEEAGVAIGSGHHKISETGFHTELEIVGLKLSQRNLHC